MFSRGISVCQMWMKAFKNNCGFWDENEINWVETTWWDINNGGIISMGHVEGCLFSF